MPLALTADERKQLCEKLRSEQADNAKFGGADPGIDRYIRVIESADGTHVCDALANEKLLPEKYRVNALRCEQLTIEGKLRPDGLAVVVFDSVTMDVDPWDNIKLRGWENGQPDQKETAELEVEADDLAKLIAQEIQANVDRSRATDS